MILVISLYASIANAHNGVPFDDLEDSNATLFERDFCAAHGYCLPRPDSGIPYDSLPDDWLSILGLVPMTAEKPPPSPPPEKEDQESEDPRGLASVKG